MINAVATCFYKPSDNKVQITSLAVDVILGVVLAMLASYSVSLGWEPPSLMQHSFVVGGVVYSCISLLKALAILKHICGKKTVVKVLMS